MTDIEDQQRLIRLQNEHLRVAVRPLGAELRSLQTADGAEWLWQGDAAWWAGRSPLLFPVVGRSRGNAVSINGRPYPMAPHGFARTVAFEVRSAAAARIEFALRAGEETHASYPFDFSLTVAYSLEGPCLSVEAELRNLGASPMPAQFGFHPGFNWPLPGAEGARHSIELGLVSSPPCYRLDAEKLLIREPEPSPFSAGRLTPKPVMFEKDAMIFLDGIGDEIAFVAKGARIDVKTKNLPHLGLWQRPGAPYLCIEPWRGTAPFADAARDLEGRNGAIVLPPEGVEVFSMKLTPARSR